MAAISQKFPQAWILNRLHSRLLGRNRFEELDWQNHWRNEHKISTTAKVADHKCDLCFQIDQAALGLSREYLIKGIENPIVEAYHSYQVDMAVLYGADRKRAEKEMREVLEFEFALANVSCAS